jgi:hypothetical protein
VVTEMMRALGIAVGAWLILSVGAYFVARAVFAIRLARAGVKLIFGLTSLPGYVEGKYRQAGPEVQQRLRSTHRWTRRLLIHAAVSVPICVLLLVLLHALRLDHG